MKRALRALANPEKAQHLSRFFKTGPGEYGAGDVFLGVVVPAQRKIARMFDALPEGEVIALLGSKVHEERLTALLVWVRQVERGDEKKRASIYRAYVANAKRVNNWDLVDLSAPQIVGRHLFDKDKAPLFRLVRSKSLWERRIAIVSTHAFIRAGQHETTFALAECLLDDEEDLMHKATGWMLREVGKRVSPARLTEFLEAYASRLPRTALRYAIEHRSPTERARWLRR